MKRIIKRLSIIALSLVLALCFAGCGSKPDVAVKTFCDALKGFDIAAARDCLQDPSGEGENLGSEEEIAEELGSEQFLDYLKECTAKMTYEIGEMTENGDTATVAVKFTYTDVSPVMKAALSDYIVKGFSMALSGSDESELEDLLYETFMEKTETEETETATCDAVFDCVKVDGEWKIGAFSEDTEAAVLNILTSNMAVAIEEWSDGWDD